MPSNTDIVISDRRTRITQSDGIVNYILSILYPLSSILSALALILKALQGMIKSMGRPKSKVTKVSTTITKSDMCLADLT